MPPLGLRKLLLRQTTQSLHIYSILSVVFYRSAQAEGLDRSERHDMHQDCYLRLLAVFVLYVWFSTSLIFYIVPIVKVYFWFSDFLTFLCSNHSLDLRGSRGGSTILKYSVWLKQELCSSLPISGWFEIDTQHFLNMRLILHTQL